MNQGTACFVLAALTITVIVANTLVIIVFKRHHGKLNKRYNLK